MLWNHLYADDNRPITQGDLAEDILNLVRNQDEWKYY